MTRNPAKIQRPLVKIFWKTIQFDVILPEKMVWPFALAFGKKFSTPQEDGVGDNIPKPIDGYFVQGGYHIRVSVPVFEEQEFYKFLRSFCQKHNLPVREEDLKPGLP